MVTILRSRNALIGIGALVVALIAVAVVLALQPPVELDQTTPEGTAQGYIQAMLDRDVNRSFAHMSDEPTRRCDHTNAHDSLRFGLADEARIVVLDTRVTGDEATVRVEVTETCGTGILTFETHSFKEPPSMERRGDGWAMAKPPWPIHECPEVQQ
jgi:hypothetical protein